MRQKTKWYKIRWRIYRMVRKPVGWALTWALFWLGDLVSRLMHINGLGFLYPVYNKLMVASSVVQDWAEVSGPWDTLGA